MTSLVICGNASGNSTAPSSDSTRWRASRSAGNAPVGLGFFHRGHPLFECRAAGLGLDRPAPGALEPLPGEEPDPVPLPGEAVLERRDAGGAGAVGERDRRRTLGETLAQDGAEQPVLRVEVVVEELLVDAGPGGDRVDPGAVDALRRELLERRGEDLAAGSLRVASVVGTADLAIVAPVPLWAAPCGSAASSQYTPVSTR